MRLCGGLFTQTFFVTTDDHFLKRCLATALGSNHAIIFLGSGRLVANGLCINGDPSRHAQYLARMFARS